MCFYIGESVSSYIQSGPGMAWQKGICRWHDSSALFFTSALMLPDAAYNKRGRQLEYRNKNDLDGLAIADGAS